jgi:hypothetical protein
LTSVLFAVVCLPFLMVRFFRGALSSSALTSLSTLWLLSSVEEPPFSWSEITIDKWSRRGRPRGRLFSEPSLALGRRVNAAFSIVGGTVVIVAVVEALLLVDADCPSLRGVGCLRIFAG